MSGRRFVIKNAYPFYRGECIFDSNQDKFIIEIEEIIDMLNSLVGYCEDLESNVKRFEKENEQLKQEVKQYWAYRDIRKQKIKDLEEQLKHIQNLIYKEKMQRLENE